MTELSSVASFRRVTPGIAASARLAMANNVPDTTKSEIALLLKKAAPILGIDGPTYHVMDILLGLSRADDWRGSGRPIVAISNAKLAEYIMRSERTVNRCIRRLVEAGIAAYRDSSTGRRFVYRNKAGEVMAGFGIDFTPARVRADELKQAVDQYQQRLNIELAAKRDISRLSRAIEDLCTCNPSGVTTEKLELQAILGDSDGVIERAERIRQLHLQTLARLAPEYVPFDMTCEGDTGVTPDIDTNPESLSESNKMPTRSNERGIFQENGRYAAEGAFEKNPTNATVAMQDKTDGEDRDADTVQGEVLGSVSVGLLQAACPGAQAMIAQQFDSWSALGRSGERLRRMIGLSEAGWADGQKKVGPYAAAAILATVLEKSIRDPEQISKPGGYFRAMIDRAIDGRLNLERSLFGLADRGYGNP
ncbi:plasmid replication protein RepCa2 [Allorhizobium ampelinum]|uniref:Replication protein C n=3 Tax=Rhizobiaceae TaxID=82115 RepID=B9K3Z8_ALLAM|nr:plasmid replication protein RepC [Agrobacterium vitis]ACM39653.1 replication protein C [Allorhizobium ampelinum S4]MCF1437100.1 plasmid replication protein RepCa2 [Allorhizobium ampelinum]ASK49689.1 transcriptional regulator TraR [Agrobacterium vitis]MCF1450768.1 plasmid replication protein RepCa2 [Allorhizobium ampelinum]MCF1496437.1 plasmid replication protein RepCa2 [Allorhizobium ampelinum]